MVLHSACGAFEDWPEFANLAGRVFNRDWYIRTIRADRSR